RMLAASGARRYPRGMPHAARRPAPVRLALCAALLAAPLGLSGCQAVLVWGAQTFWSHSAPDVPDDIVATRDVVFASRPTGDLLLDVYRPADRAGEPRPVVLYAFGGGWMSGNRHQFTVLDLFRLVDRGYVIATADYRWSTDAIFPAQIHDVKAALRWLRAHADEHGIDPTRVAILGPSAGGHLASLAGTSGDVATLEGATPDTWPGESSRVQAVVDFFGPSELETYRAQHVENGLGNTNSLFFLEMLIGGAVEANPELAASASPMAYLDADDPPFLIIHGDEDPVVPIQQSRRLLAALETAGVDATFRLVPGGDHGRSEAYASDAMMNAIGDFLDRSLGVAP
ncbi:MAG: alpha/beta hydrolase, partial [Myxococcota bacterium]